MADDLADPWVDPATTPATLRLRARHPIVGAVTWRARRYGGGLLRLLLQLAHPLTWWRLTVALCAGAAATVGTWWRWRRGDDLDYLRDHNGATLDRRVQARKRGTWFAVIVGCGAWGLLQLRWPWLRWAVPALLAAVLVAIGRQERRILADEPLLTVLDPPEDYVLRAVATALRLRDADDLVMRSPVQRDGAAWVGRVELPPGRHAGELTGAAARKALASALGVAYGQVWPAGVDGNERLVDVRCLDDDRVTGHTTRHPLAARPRRTSAWDPTDLGRDLHGSDVQLQAVDVAVLIGGVQQVGKSTVAAAFVVQWLLDPVAKVVVIDGKGLNSRPYQHLCERVGVASDPQSIVGALGWTLDECERRIDRLADLGVDRLTAEVSQRHRDLGLVLVWVDELRRIYKDQQPAVAAEVERLLSGILALAPTVGVLLIGATHHPGVDVLPGPLRSLFRLRIAFYCADMHHSEAVLGTGARALGARAEELPADVLGAAILLGAGPKPVHFRSHRITVEDLQRVAAVAYDLRAAEGTLPQRPDQDVGQVPPLLAECLAAFDAGDGVDALRTADLLAVLQAANPARAGWDPMRLATELRPYGVAPVQLGRKHAQPGERNPRGYRREAFAAAVLQGPLLRR